MKYFTIGLMGSIAWSTVQGNTACNPSDIIKQFKSDPSHYQYEMAINKNNLEYLSVSCTKPENGVNEATNADVKAYKAMQNMIKDPNNTNYQKWGRFKCNKFGKWVPLWPGWGNMEYCPGLNEWAEYQNSGWTEKILDQGCSFTEIEHIIKSYDYNLENYIIEDVDRDHVTASTMLLGVKVTCKPPVNGEERANYADVKAFKEFSKYIRQEDSKFMTATFKCNNNKQKWIPNSPAEQAFPFECPDAKDWNVFWENLVIEDQESSGSSEVDDADDQPNDNPCYACPDKSFLTCQLPGQEENQFIVCADGEPFYHDCGPGTIYDETTKICKLDSNNGQNDTTDDVCKSCPSDGSTCHLPADQPDQFIVCIHSNIFEKS